MTLGAKSAEVFCNPQTRAIQDSSTPSDSARQGAWRQRVSNEMRHQEGTFSRPKPQNPKTPL